MEQIDMNALQKQLGGGGGGASVEEIQAQQAQAAERESQREMILDQILEGPAKERIARMKLVRAEKARSVEDSLIRAATNGQLKSKVTEDQLIAMLNQISGGADDATGDSAGGKKKGITIQRRKYGMDEDDDDDNDDDL